MKGVFIEKRYVFKAMYISNLIELTYIDHYKCLRYFLHFTLEDTEVVRCVINPQRLILIEHRIFAFLKTIFFSNHW